MKVFRLLHPKHFQIIFLSTFLLIGILHLEFQLAFVQSILCLSTAFFIQYSFFTYFKVPNRNYLSAFITGLSLCLLLRTNTLWVHPVAATLAMSSKFLVRYKEKHFFNPANFGIIISLMFFPCWVSQGQWGHQAILVFIFVMLGFVVTQRARVGWVSIQFLTTFMALIFFRHAYLGFEHKMTMHALMNGSLLVFAFFMISDPKTNPKTFWGRWAHVGAVTILFGTLQFEFYIQNALFWALFCTAPLIPHWDRLLGKKHA